MERVTTGIPGLDSLVQGGYPRGSAILISGTPGAGKTIFTLQYLIEGAKRQERGVYISFEEDVDQIKTQASQFGWDIEKYESLNLLRVVSLKAMNVHIDRVVQEIEHIVVNFAAERVVLDSLTTIVTCVELMQQHDIYSKACADTTTIVIPKISDEILMRKAITYLINKIRVWKKTVLLTSELPENTSYLSRDTISEFLVDGVILLRATTVAGVVNRVLEVKKMRATNITNGVGLYTFTPQGIVVSTEEKQ